MSITEEFYEDVIHRLSGWLVDVELDYPDVERAFKYAKRQYQKKGSDNFKRALFPLDVVPGKNTYELPPEINTVNELIQTKSDYGFTAEEPFSQAVIQDYFSHSNAYGRGNYFLMYDLTLQMLENNRMYTASEPNFTFSRMSHELFLQNPPSVAKEWLVDAYVYLSDKQYQDVLWILDYTVAECKQILGRAYRQFGSLPGPAGDTQTDGDQLVQEAQREKEALMEEIDNFLDGEPEAMGVYIG